MKKIILFSAICFYSVLLIQAQSNIKISNDISFYSTYPETSIKNVTDTTIISDNNLMIYRKQLKLNAPFSTIQTLGSGEGDHYSIYEVISNPNYDKTTSLDRDTDTLFFVLDQVYDYGVDRILLNRESSTCLEEVTWVNDTFAYKVLEHCTLNIVSILRPGYGIHELNMIFKENYVFNDKDTIFLSAFQATHDLIWEPVDINGGPLSTQGYVRNIFTIFFPLINGGYSTVEYRWFTSCTYRISDYRGAVPILFGNEVVGNYESGLSKYLIEYPYQDSILEDVNFTNEPTQFAKLDTEYSYSVERDSNRVGLGNFLKWINWNGNAGFLGWISYDYQYANPSWSTTLYMDLQDIDDFGYSMKYYLDYFVKGNKIEYVESPFYDEFDGSIAGCFFLTPEPDLHLFNNGDYVEYGKGFSYYWSNWNNNSTAIQCETDNMGMWGEYFSEDTITDTYKIVDASGILIHEGNGLSILSYGFDPGIYTVEQKRTATQFYAHVGTSTLTSILNTTNEDNVPPHVIRVYLQTDYNSIRYTYRSGERVILKFTASDFVSYDNFYGTYGFQPLAYSNTKISIKLHDENEWTDIEYSEIHNDTLIGTQYYAELTDYLTIDSTMYDVKIYIEDLSGNSTEHVFSPAFIYGDFMVNISDDYNMGDSQEKIIIYPNPSYDEVIINNKCQVVDFYEIMNINGNLIKNGEINKNTKLSKVNIHDLSPGIYVITVYNENKTIQTEKIVKL